MNEEQPAETSLQPHEIVRTIQVTGAKPLHAIQITLNDLAMLIEGVFRADRLEESMKFSVKALRDAAVEAQQYKDRCESLVNHNNALDQTNRLLRAEINELTGKLEAARTRKRK